jgi:hypothetical protein
MARRNSKKMRRERRRKPLTKRKDSRDWTYKLFKELKTIEKKQEKTQESL